MIQAISTVFSKPDNQQYLVIQAVNTVFSNPGRFINILMQCLVTQVTNTAFSDPGNQYSVY